MGEPNGATRREGQEQSLNAVTRPAPGHHILRRRIREALAAGLLPLGRVGSVVRIGSGRPCFICREVVNANNIEREVQIGTQGNTPVIVHEPCYLLWRVETLALHRLAQLPAFPGA